MKYGLGFLSKDNQTFLLNGLSEIINVWALNWSSQKINEINFEFFSPNLHADFFKKGIMYLDDDNLIGMFSQDYKENLIKILFDDISREIPKDEIYNYLLNRAIKDLLGNLLKFFKIKTLVKNIRDTTEINTDGVLLIFCINFEKSFFRLLLDSNILEKDISNLVQLNNKFSIMDSIPDKNINVTVNFSLDKIFIEELLDLKKGDIIKSQHLIFQPFDINCNNSTIAKGSLGYSQEKLAVLIETKG